MCNGNTAKEVQLLQVKAVIKKKWYKSKVLKTEINILK